MRRRGARGTKLLKTGLKFSGKFCDPVFGRGKKGGVGEGCPWRARQQRPSAPTRGRVISELILLSRWDSENSENALRVVPDSREPLLCSSRSLREI